MSLRVISYGGGVQSTALVVLAAAGRIEATDALFSNVGDDSEHPATLRYVREVMTPWAAERGVTVRELHPPQTLRSKIVESNSVMIPAFGASGSQLLRTCSERFKIRTTRRWLRENGATRTNPATVAIGFSVDEIHRANEVKQSNGYARATYPLLDLGLHRHECESLIAGAGLPVPPKSSCYFCPYHRPSVWAEMRRDEPELFAAAAELETHLEAKGEPVYLTKAGRPLTEVVQEAQRPLFAWGSAGVVEMYETAIGDDGCDEGACWT